MLKKKDVDSIKSVIVLEVDPMECPFREFKDNELSPDLWGLSPAALRAITPAVKTLKPPADFVWVDEQTQPLPRSIRKYLHGWVRAEELAEARWGAEVVVFEEGSGSCKMSVMETQLGHAQVLMRSAFCRRVMSACYILERVEGLMVEHQWENFLCSFAPEGWRARYHVYSPGMKSGGGLQHRPGLSKNGCYMVRLYHLGAWRCVWVSDQVPVDATDAPLLPFSPLLSRVPPPPTKTGLKGASTMVTSNEVHLWPLLICKALLKLAAPDMNSDEDTDDAEDELMPEFDVFHALTGCMNVTTKTSDRELLWQLLLKEVPVFSWDDDDDTLTSTVKTKSTKKPAARETTYRIRNSMATVVIKDTKNHPPYWLPGVTPGHEMSLLVSMIRDLPLKKPLPEPEVAPWRYYRWVDWAKLHGLYEDYACPRTKFVKINGLMKMSYAPHLLDVTSTETITKGFREEHEKTPAQTKKGGVKSEAHPAVTAKTAVSSNQLKEELREWIRFEPLQMLIKKIVISYYPSMFQNATAARNPPVRITKAGPVRADVVAPKCAPLYIQLDGPDKNYLKLSLTCLHPRILVNSGIPIMHYIEPAYLILEKFEWFEGCSVPIAKAFVETRGYDAVEANFQPGRHFFRLWIHSRMNFHVHLLTESTLLLGPCDVIQSTAVRECPWAAKFLNNLLTASTNWIKTTNATNIPNTTLMSVQKEFLKSYKPDLEWNRETVGYDQAFLHWMFRQALQSLLRKRLPTWEYHGVCAVLRYYFQDPDFGLPPKPALTKSVRERVAMDPCDCTIPEAERMEEADCLEEEVLVETTQLEEKLVVKSYIMDTLLAPPVLPVVSQICELATDKLPCGALKEEREKAIRKHEAATVLQAHWRGTRARKCLNVKLMFSPELMKCIMDNAFGNLEVLSALMKQFFGMYPGAKTAYSVASALGGVNGLYQHQGTSVATPKCKWIPYFQGVFYCHAPVKAHLAIQSSLQYSTVMVYDNDTGLQMPQAFNAPITFDFAPNRCGYTVMGHGTVGQAAGVHSEVNWQLVVLSSIDGAFHVCDNDIDGCKVVPLQGSQKLHFNEVFIPNRRNILGGLLISASKQEALCFRAAVTSPELEIVATLRSTSVKGEPEELGTCSGKGEIYWPYIRLQPFSHQADAMDGKKLSTSHANLYTTEPVGTAALTTRSLKSSTKNKGLNTGKSRSMTKQLKTIAVEPKQYTIEVTASDGWPLTLAQWRRVREVRDSQELLKLEAVKKPMKPLTGKDKDKIQGAPSPVYYTPRPNDAYIDLECSLAIGGGATACLDNLRALEFAEARKEWTLNDPGRNARGAEIRQEFREEFLEALPPPASDSAHTVGEEIFGEEMEGEEWKREQLYIHQGPSPATESGLLEMIEFESEEESKYLLMPTQLRDKFIPLDFLPFCMKEKNEEQSVLVSNDMAEAAKQDRHARMDAALERMKELQSYNLENVLQRQRRRCRLLETLFIDATWRPELVEALEGRNEAIAQETLLRQLSATKKKKVDSKKK